MDMADHVLSYLYGTKNLSLLYDVTKEELDVYTDASFADNLDRKSSQGLLIKLFEALLNRELPSKRRLQRLQLKRSYWLPLL